MICKALCDTPVEELALDVALLEKLEGANSLAVPLCDVCDEERATNAYRSPGRHTPVAQLNLGATYENGRGVKQDHAEAVAWFRKAGVYRCAVHSWCRVQSW